MGGLEIVSEAERFNGIVSARITAVESGEPVGVAKFVVKRVGDAVLTYLSTVNQQNEYGFLVSSEHFTEPFDGNGRHVPGVSSVKWAGSLLLSEVAGRIASAGVRKFTVFPAFGSELFYSKVLKRLSADGGPVERFVEGWRDGWTVFLRSGDGSDEFA